MEDKNILQIKNEVVSANNRMDVFNLTRRGDRITLSFGQWIEGGRAEYVLEGEKADYYRMAMGVNLQDTLAILMGGEKKVKVVGAEGDKKNITITLNMPGKEPPKPAPVKQDKTKSVDQEINEAYAVALESGDVEKLLTFANKYKDSPKAKLAANFADRITSEKEYERLGPNPDIETLKKFVSDHPSSRHFQELSSRIQVLEREATEKRVEAERKKARELEEKRLAEEEAEKRRVAQAEEKARREKEAEAQRLRTAAEEKERRERAAEERLRQEKSKAQAEMDAYFRARNSAEGLKEYLAEYPRGAYVVEAQALLSKLQKDRDEGDKGPGSKYRLVVGASSKVPTLDGDGSDPVWSSAAPLNIDLDPQTKKASRTTLEVRALLNGGRIYMRLKWRDGTGDSSYRPWVWDAVKQNYTQTDALDDAAAVAIYAEASVDDSCMLHGQNHKTDVWLWRAFWAEISGKASDQMMVTSTERLPKSNPYLSKTGKGQVWVQNLADRGRQGWRYDIPLPSGNQPKVVPSYKADNASGSASDVDASGKYRDGYWTVEFSRALDTGNDDDVAIPKNGKVYASFAVFDKAEREDHSSSQLVQVELQGR